MLNGSDGMVLADTERPTQGSGQTAAQGPILWTARVLDIWTLEQEVVVHHNPSSLSPALDLILQGYVAKTATMPTIVVAVSTLQLLYRLRQRQPSLSIEAFTKVICDYYNVRV